MFLGAARPTGQLDHLLLGGVEKILAFLLQLHAFLEDLEGLLERKLSGIEAAHALLELAESLFEAAGRGRG